MAANEAVLSNPIFEAINRVGQTPQEAIHVWGQGLAVHHGNLLASLAENEAKVREAILTDIWKFVHQQGLADVNYGLGLTAEPDLDHLNRLLSEILADAEHPKLTGLGADVNASLVNWVKAFTLYDWAAYTYLEKHLGSKDGLKIYMGLWESFALGVLPDMKEALGIDRPEDLDMAMIKTLSENYWAAIGCAGTTTRFNDDVYEAELSDCAYWLNMKDMLGEAKARSMTLKTEAAVSVNYYDAILKALGVFDRYSFTMDQFQCCGDDHCRVRFERRT
ncbi:MAG: hypothetical protein KJ621_04440 [Proteobacteria bacterium]|nr:hypothetical protein [Pseudomonadota bacterium]MBU1742514.1 hypothetical protein [Pseudomonadota bacterium]